MAPFAADAAREFIEAGRAIRSVEPKEKRINKRMTERDACKALRDYACLLEIAQEDERELSNDNKYWADHVAEAYVDAGDFAAAERIMEQAAHQDAACFRFARIFGIERMISEQNFARAEDWLRAWMQCRAANEPNYETGYGEGGNLWAELAFASASLSRGLSKAGETERSRQAAVMSLLFAIETDRTWRVDDLGYRADDLGQAYGAAFGALSALQD